jgi:hypothetical protein
LSIFLIPCRVALWVDRGSRLLGAVGKPRVQEPFVAAQLRREKD